MTSKNLIRMIASPSKVASALNWRKTATVLSVDIHRDIIGLAISAHPSIQERATTLGPISLCKKGKVAKQDKEYLADIIRANNVCGIVVSWPLQEDSGRMGAACGRVSHTLEDLIDDDDASFERKPLCFWDSKHAIPSAQDQFGRSEAYCRTTNKRIHRASEEQYNQDQNIVASQVWKDFMLTHWPEISKDSSGGNTRTADAEDNWEDGTEEMV